jgi:hypothetical protein
MCGLYQDIDLVIYMHVNRLQWAEHVVRIFDNKILEGNLGGRRPTGKLRERWEDEERKMPVNCTIASSGETQE